MVEYLREKPLKLKLQKINVIVLWIFLEVCDLGMLEITQKQRFFCVFSGLKTAYIIQFLILNAEIWRVASLIIKWELFGAERH